MAANSPSVPQDMRDLLIRLDQKVEDGFSNTKADIAEIKRSNESFDGRLRTLEESNTRRGELVVRFLETERKVEAHGTTLDQLVGAGKGLAGFTRVLLPLIVFIIGVAGGGAAMKYTQPGQAQYQSAPVPAPQSGQ